METDTILYVKKHVYFTDNCVIAPLRHSNLIFLICATCALYIP
jgi:hypothetical protein